MPNPTLRTSWRRHRHRFLDAQPSPSPPSTKTVSHYKRDDPSRSSDNFEDGVVASTVVVEDETDVESLDNISEVVLKPGSLARISVIDNEVPVEIPQEGVALILDSTSLKFAMDPSNKGLFIELVTCCTSVICCRVTPSQKVCACLRGF